MKTFTTRASYEAVKRCNLEVVGQTHRIANDSRELCQPMPGIRQAQIAGDAPTGGEPFAVDLDGFVTFPGDIHPMAVAVVRVPVDPSECKTQLGRILAETIDNATGSILVTCLTKTDRDRDINGFHPGTPEHEELCRTWGIKDTPIRHWWEGWTNICKGDNETGAQYFDRMARLIAGNFIDETFTVTRTA